MQSLALQRLVMGVEEGNHGRRVAEVAPGRSLCRRDWSGVGTGALRRLRNGMDCRPRRPTTCRSTTSGSLT
jgi:hypothetical protein